MALSGARTTEGSRPVRRRRTSAALLAAAEQAFSRWSFEEVTVEEVAERAGVAVGSIYNNFGSKVGLYTAVVLRALEVDRERTARAFAEEQAPLAQLQAVAEAYLRFAFEQPELFRLLAAPVPLAGCPIAEPVAEGVANRVADRNERLVAAIERGIVEGSIRPVDARRTASVLWASWHGMSLTWRTDEPQAVPDDLGALLAIAVDLLRRALRNDAEQ